MPKTIVILGTGNVGKCLTKLLVKHNYEEFLGSRNPIKGKNLAAAMGNNVEGGSILEATQFSNIIVLAVPYYAVEQIIKVAGNLYQGLMFHIYCLNHSQFH